MLLIGSVTFPWACLSVSVLCWSVCHNFLRGPEVTHNKYYRSTRSYLLFCCRKTRLSWSCASRPGTPTATMSPSGSSQTSPSSPTRSGWVVRLKSTTGTSGLRRLRSWAAPRAGSPSTGSLWSTTTRAISARLYPSRLRDGESEGAYFCISSIYLFTVCSRGKLYYILLYRYINI